MKSVTELITQEKLENIKQRIIAVLKKKRKKVAKDVLEQMAERILQSRIARYKLTRVRGIFVGDCGIVDLVERMKQRAQREADEDFERAKFLKYIREDGVLLDYRRTITTRSGRVVPNPHFGKPLDELRMERRTLYGIFLTETIPEYRFYEVVLTSNVTREIPLFTSVEFFGRIFNSNIRIPEYCVIQELEEQEDYVEDILGYVDTMPIGEIGKWLDKHKNEWDRKICTTGFVFSIVYQVTERDTRIVRIESNGNAITCYCPIYLPLDFAEGSRVFVVGRPFRTKRGILSMSVFGIYAYKAEKIAREEREEIDLILRDIEI